ncbi:MAG: hypothetical protein HY719_06250, partial [Planctomycetes bacterium]|nr:hypothetical protein [Planctomycetota bacterium]
PEEKKPEAAPAPAVGAAAKPEEKKPEAAAAPANPAAEPKPEEEKKVEGEKVAPAPVTVMKPGVYEPPADAKRFPLVYKKWSGDENEKYPMPNPKLYPSPMRWAGFNLSDAKIGDAEPKKSEKVLAAGKALIVKDGLKVMYDAAGNGSKVEQWKEKETPQDAEVDLLREDGAASKYHLEWINMVKFTWGDAKTRGARYLDPTVMRIRVRRKCHMEGEVLGKKFILTDDDTNGKFDDYGEDGFMWGADKQGRYLSEIVKLDKDWYNLRVKPDGSEAAAWKYDGPIGKFDFDLNYPGPKPRWLFVRADKPNVAELGGDAPLWFVDLMPLGKGPAEVPCFDPTKNNGGTGWRVYRGILVGAGKPEAAEYCTIAGDWRSTNVSANPTATRLPVLRAGRNKDPKQVSMALDFSGSVFQLDGKEQVFLGWYNGRQLEVRGGPGGEFYTDWGPLGIYPEWEVFDDKKAQRLGNGRAVVFNEDYSTNATGMFDPFSYVNPKVQSVCMPTEGRGRFFAKMKVANHPLLGSIESDFKEVKKEAKK